MATIPPVVPPLSTEQPYARDLAPGAPFAWLREGWRDLATNPGPSLLYGIFVFLISVGIVAGLIWSALDYALFPAIAGFLVFAPALAIGLYEKSRALEQGESVSLRHMLLPHARAGEQVLFTGALLCGVMLLWMRAAVIVYALFFGVRPFPGLDHIAPMLFTSSTGIAMLAVGTLVGGLFAAFSFASSAFSIPMMLDKRVDALTAMGTSWGLVWNNLQVMLIWGALVLALFLLSVATGFVGLIIVFPWLGHATWHAYRAVR
ncbi:hypothetical protein NT2_12_01280 [Caenibius tardaugens NBRC 16725]|uniref:Cytochrome c oxidase subunit I n=1 Tax=Caenibius tardaugens NBRC 16725 TaxID=1219035 RepID=U2ZZS0_9SPHN|nr:DUF2189 domain-containing protein [Caenibius tardaugens]AZI36331.1 DUF2189 domain-containing protein [Caenibius tardaugens NBRC 16725]GAD50869.1 hypothetical protein NT2_12_01280 [Caenibius tardaugens NBRC 16725]